jgi:hypothetical protein
MIRAKGKGLIKPTRRELVSWCRALIRTTPVRSTFRRLFPFIAVVLGNYSAYIYS